jgi:hypothetical protein
MIHSLTAFSNQSDRQNNALTVQKVFSSSCYLQKESMEKNNDVATRQHKIFIQPRRSTEAAKYSKVHYVRSK